MFRQRVNSQTLSDDYCRIRAVIFGITRMARFFFLLVIHEKSVFVRNLRLGVWFPSVNGISDLHGVLTRDTYLHMPEVRRANHNS